MHWIPFSFFTALAILLKYTQTYNFACYDLFSKNRLRFVNQELDVGFFFNTLLKTLGNLVI